MEAIQSSIQQASGSAIIALLTDGEDNGKSGNPATYATQIKQTNDALTQSRSLLYPVGIGEADDALLETFARNCGTPYIHAADVSRLPALYGSMAASLAGGVVTTVRVSSRAGDKPGSSKRLKITLAGYPKSVDASYQIPQKAGATNALDRRLVLKIQVHEGGQPAPRLYTRTLCTLGPGRDPGRCWLPTSSVSVSGRRRFGCSRRGRSTRRSIS